MPAGPTKEGDGEGAMEGAREGRREGGSLREGFDLMRAAWA